MAWSNSSWRRTRDTSLPATVSPAKMDGWLGNVSSVNLRTQHFRDKRSFRMCRHQTYFWQFVGNGLPTVTSRVSVAAILEILLIISKYHHCWERSEVLIRMLIKMPLFWGPRSFWLVQTYHRFRKNSMPPPSLVFNNLKNKAQIPPKHLWI